MPNTIKLLVLLFIPVLILTGCAKQSDNLVRKDAQDQGTIWSAINNASAIIDVRSSEEYSAGHLEGAINIPHDQISRHLSELSQWKESSVVVYCKSGRRAGIAQTVLQENGFMNVTNAGGYSDIIAAHK